MIIVKIIRTELQNLFFSPVAWFLATVFLIQCAYFYLLPLNEFAAVIDWSRKHGIAVDGNTETSFTNYLFFTGGGIIQHVNENLYLFIPLLTMGVISREINNGTIKLLYSSPVKLRHIVLGKYLAVMAFVLLLVGILALFMLMGAFQIRSVDYGLFLSALLGFCLLGGAYSAIGMFTSSLTNYQIVSGIATFMVLFILDRIGGLWQQYDFIRDLTWFLSIAGRTQQMLAGLITTRDVIYFIILIAMFLSFTLLKLQGEKESKPWTIKAARYAMVIITAVLLGYVTSRPALVGYLDATAEDVNTIAPETQQLLKKMGKEPLEITLYDNLWGSNIDPGLPQGRNAYLYGFWDRYIRFKPDIKFKYVYYYDNDAKYYSFPGKTEKQILDITAKLMMLDPDLFIPAKEIRKQIDPYSEDLNLFMTARYKGDTINLRTYGDPVDPWPKEQEVASKFKRLIEKKGPKVYFLTGNLERSIYKTGEREYYVHTIAKNNRESLVNAAFDVDTLSLEKQDIPAGATALILADPRTELGSATRDKLKKYIAGGGNLMVLGEPGKQDIVNPVLQQLGVQQMKGQLVQTTFDETPDKIRAYTLKSTLHIIQQDKIAKQAAFASKLPDTASIAGMHGAAALTYSEAGPFRIDPLIKTFPDGPKTISTDYGKDATPAQKIVRPYVQRQTWVKMGHLVIDSVPPVFSPEDGDIKDSVFVPAVSLTRQVGARQQRAAVMGDADVMSNFRGPMFGLSFYNWFDYGEHPVTIPKHYYKDGILTVSFPTAKMLFIICMWVLPGLLILFGTILLIRRKRK